MLGSNAQYRMLQVTAASCSFLSFYLLTTAKPIAACTASAISSLCSMGAARVADVNPVNNKPQCIMSVQSAFLQQASIMLTMLETTGLAKLAIILADGLQISQAFVGMDKDVKPADKKPDIS